MGCASSLSNQNAKNSSKILREQDMLVIKDVNTDLQANQLLSELQSALDSGDAVKQKSLIFDINQKSLSYSQQCANPVQVFTKILDQIPLLSCPYLQKQLAHASQLYLHQVFNKTKVSQIQKQNWLEKVKQLQNSVSASVNANELQFELECICSCAKLLGTGKNDLSSSVLEYAKLIANGILDAEHKDVLQAGKEIIAKICGHKSEKMDEMWVLAVMTNYYTQFLSQTKPDLITGILDQLQEQNDWHVIFAGIDAIETFLEEHNQQIEHIVKLLTQFSHFKQGPNSWKIRDRVAQLCIRNATTQNPVDQLMQIYLDMIAHEENKTVQTTLKNADYIQNQKKKLQESWEKSKNKQDEELQECGKQLQEIQKYLDNNKIGVSTEEYQKYEERKIEILNTIQFTNQIHQLMDVKSKVLEQLYNSVVNQEVQLTNLQQRLNIVDKQVNGRMDQELVTSIFDYYKQESVNWQTRLSMYIPENGVRDSADINNVSKIVDVDQMVMKFITDPQLKSMLIQGGAGTGKTIFCQYLIAKLLDQRQIVPIYVNLPQLQNWQTQMIEETLAEMKLSQIEVQSLQSSNMQFLFVIDGFDEVQCTKNLHQLNHLLNWNCKTLFTCRSSHIAGDSNYQRYFIPSQLDRSVAFTEVVLVHFNDQQVNDYLKRFVQKKQNKWSWEVYRTHIDSIPGLLQLVQNPFVLSMIVSVLPQLVSKRNKNQSNEKLISLDLYEEFAQHWFETEEERMFNNNVNTEIYNLKTEYEKYALKLATKMTDSLKTIVEYKTTDTSSQWSEFFNQKNKQLETVRRGVPLNVTSKFYSFIHKSIQEYFAAKNGVKQVQWLITNTTEALTCSFNNNLISDKGVFQFFNENIVRNITFKNQLYQIIEISKTDARVSIAAANAITILNMANESFQYMNFQNIKIPGANLSSAMMLGADFTGANLQNVDFQQAWLENAILKNANMDNVQFGQQKYLKKVFSVQFSQNGEYFVCSNQEYLYSLYNTQQQNIICQYKPEQSCQSTMYVQFCSNNIIIMKKNQLDVMSIKDFKLIKSYQFKNKINGVYSKNFKYLLQRCDDSIKIYSTDDYSLIKEIQFKEDINKTCFSFNCKYILCLSYNAIYILEFEQGELVHKIDKPTQFGYRYNKVLTNLDDTLLIYSLIESNKIYILNMSTFEPVVILQDSKENITALLISNNGKYLVAGDYKCKAVSYIYGKLNIFNQSKALMLIMQEQQTLALVKIIKPLFRLVLMISSSLLLSTLHYYQSNIQVIILVWRKDLFYIIMIKNISFQLIEMKIYYVGMHLMVHVLYQNQQ
ncbi:Pentapeptide_repeats-containing protein [Hexamita inflata]|uniref:Pentapeptide repeats-containing protein n=1 Tax=Hexamita inflata TaxID=28002 RepID=A0AA86PIJ3_9EUKA|nr:Pentapeptide repeats-containing protein [Hexamita inflata]